MNVELRGITKRFGAIVANDNIDLSIRAGEILALLGENGAGKTTLMNVLSGLYQPDAGEIAIDGAPVRFASARDSIAAGIGMVHQHFMLVPVFTVAENVVLGVEPTGALDRLKIAAAREEVRRIGGELGFDVDPDAIIEQLPVGVQQRVEIIKVLFRAADVLIFDEPTAVLTPQEVDEFFAILRSLQQAGKAIVFISHKLHELRAVATRISVLRDGKLVGEADPRTITDQELAELMVGRPVDLGVTKAPATPGAPLLEARGLEVLNEREEIAVAGVDLTVRAGEIVGIAGVQGNGQTELVEAITGMRTVAGGTLMFVGHDITRASTRTCHRLGMAHIPEDRRRSGMIGEFTVAENMVLNSYYEPRFATGITLRWPDVYAASAKNVIDFDVRTPSIFSAADTLSGGNQQKLVVARELSRDVKLLVAAQPTRGLDVGSVDYVHDRLIEARDKGTGVLLVSTELDEVMSLSDRILVMYRGRIIREFDAATVTKNEVGLAMAGAVQ
ncbi:MAG TPA: ABC transporter ATP-binding protein [Alphaproteobacteria bacterium]|nr:ABC transporter ATP-binding protein [Alphaproteobacteria bacterium]